VQDYAKDKMTLLNGLQSDAPYGNTTVSDYLKSNPGAGFLAPYGDGNNVYYKPGVVQVGDAVGGDFAHEILHKLDIKLTDDVLLWKLHKDPRRYPSGEVSKAIEDHCYKN
jgi:hypothetical protein